VNMPGWDGLKTLEAFRAHPALKGVKVIMLTADASKQTVMAAIHGGAHDYVIKTTFSKADFYRKVNRLIPGSITSVGPLVVEFEADRASAAKIEDRSLAGASDRQHAGSATLEAPALTAATTTAANVESRLQELIDGWE